MNKTRLVVQVNTNPAQEPSAQMHLCASWHSLYKHPGALSHWEGGSQEPGGAGVLEGEVCQAGRGWGGGPCERLLALEMGKERLEEVWLCFVRDRFLEAPLRKP